MSVSTARTIADMPSGGGHVRTYGIADLATEFGLTHRTIRFYEDEGLLSPSRAGLNRIYSHRDRGRLALICRAKRLGFSIAEIRDFIRLYDVDDRQIEQMRYFLTKGRERIAVLEQQLQDVRQTLDELRRIDSAAVAHLRQNGVDVADLVPM